MFLPVFITKQLVMSHNFFGRIMPLYVIQTGPELNYVAQAGSPPALASGVLGLQVCATTPCRTITFEYKSCIPLL